MKFIVTRSNCSPRENPDCPGVEKEMVPRYGNLEEAYTIEINTIEELTQLTKKLENPLIIFNESDWGFELPEIEIYDGYRE